MYAFMVEWLSITSIFICIYNPAVGVFVSPSVCDLRIVDVSFSEFGARFSFDQFLILAATLQSVLVLN